MSDAVQLLSERNPKLKVEGEMQADSALSEPVRSRSFPSSRLTGIANLLVMPTLDAANIALNLLQTSGHGLSVGPMLVGTARPTPLLSQPVTYPGHPTITPLAVLPAPQPARTTPR